MTQRIISPDDGPRTRVADLIGHPMAIPARVLEVLPEQFLSATLLRDAGPNANGLVSYSESTPLYLDANPEIVGEFGEIPVAAGQRGLPRTAASTPVGLGVRISRRMRDTNNIGEVNRQITQLRNTFVLNDETALRALFDNPAIPTVPASLPWDQAGSVPRRDVAKAKRIIKSQKPAGADNYSRFGFKPDTLVMSDETPEVLSGNDNWNAVYDGRDSVVNEDIRYTGALSGRPVGLDPLESGTFIPNADRVLVLERGTVGFYSDFQALQITELYPEGNGPNGGPTQSWRSDATRERVKGVDQPFAACWITGIKS